MKRILTVIFLICSVFAIISCGGSALNGGEDYGNILDTPGGLILTQDKHQIGWKQSDCTMCHNLENIHLVNRTGIPIDIQEIHDEALEGGISTCASCHGDNGVQ